MNSQDPLISVVLPCYNEEKTIGTICASINNVGLKNVEIIVVDDGSKDNSVDIVKNIPNTVVYIHEKNMGYGKTLVDGILKAKGDYIVTIDSDGQHQTKDIPVLLSILKDKNADIIVGSRYAGTYNYNIPFINRAGEAFIESYLRLIFHRTIKNNQGGFRIFSRKSLKIFDYVHNFDMVFTTEILMIAFILKLKVVEGPIELLGRLEGRSRVRRVKLLFDTFRCFLEYTIKYYLPFLLKKKNNL